MALTTVPVELANLDGAVTVNESSADVDFRIESDTNANSLFLEGSTSHIGLGTGSPDDNGFGAGHGILAVASATGSAKTAMLNLMGDGNDTDATRVASVFFNDQSATGAGKTLAGVEAYRASNHATDPGADLVLSTNVSGGSYTERMRITSSTHNHVVIGSSSATDVTGQWATGAVLDVHDSGSSNTGTIILSNDLTASDNGVGSIVWANRNNSNAGASTNKAICAITASTSTSDSNSGDDCGGYLRFYTKSEAGNLTQRIVIGTHGWTQIDTADQTSYPLRSNNTHASFNGWMYGTDATRAGSSDFYMFVGRANIGSATDNEYLLRGDGNAYADGAWNGGGADYAEYFEWKDGNSDSEDRRGYPVVLDGNMIRKATSDDVASSIIGIVSTAPAIVGDSDTEQYKQKYLKDDFGSFIWEDYTVTEWDEINFEGGIGPDSKPISYHTDQIPSDVTPPSEDVKNEDGQVVKTKAVVTSTDADGNNLRRRKLNPDYDSSKTYETRESRKEWETIGLMGKLRMRKGQPTGDRWIKMRDITDSIEEWLVR